MGGSPAPLSAVVVDRRPLERNLVRFLLEENGITVSAEAGTPFDAMRELERNAPGVVVLNANTAWDARRPLIPLIRAVAPETAVVLIAPATGMIEVDLLRHADAVLEEGVGLKDLVPAIRRLMVGETTPQVQPTLPHIVPEATTDAPEDPRRVRRFVWLERLRGASVAAVLLVGFMFVRSEFQPSTRISLVERASTTLEQLVDAMEERDGARATTIAFELGSLLNDAEQADVAALQAKFADEDFVKLLEGIPGARDVVEAALEPIIGDDLTAVSPSPAVTTPTQASPTPGADGDDGGDGQDGDNGQGQGLPVEPPDETTSPTETPPTETPSTETPSTETPSPTVTATETTSPTVTTTETTSPTSTETPSPTVTTTETTSPTSTETPPPTTTSTETPPPTETTPTETPSPTVTSTETPPPTETTPREPPPSPPPPETEAPLEEASAIALLVPGALLWLRVRARRRED